MLGVVLEATSSFRICKIEVIIASVSRVAEGALRRCALRSWLSFGSSP